MRIPEYPVYVKAFEALGTKPVRVTWGEAYLALVQGVSDAMECGFEFIYPSKFHEAAKYITWTYHLYDTRGAVMNPKRFNTLPKDLQQVMMDAFIAGEKNYNDQMQVMKVAAGAAIAADADALKPSIDKATEAGIPVVTILGDLPDSKRLAFVGSRQYDLGYTGGKAIAEALGGKGKVAILSIPGVGMFDDREQGFRAAFSEYPGIEVVQVGDTKADTVTAVSVAKDIMQRQPDLAAFVGTDSTGGIGAGTAVKEAGKIGQVKVVAMDRNSDVLQMIKEGVLTGTVAQDDASMAFNCMVVLYNYVNNQAPLTSDNAAAKAITGPTNVFMHVNYIDKSNLDYYLAANAEYTK